jgi:hypothetical protein
MKMETEKFDLLKMQKKGVGGGVTTAIAVVVLLILISAMAPTALVGLFNSTAFRCVGGNCSIPTGVPAWVPPALGALGAIAFVYLIWRAASK